jgi:hypothetical protein
VTDGGRGYFIGLLFWELRIEGIYIILIEIIRSRKAISRV